MDPRMYFESLLAANALTDELGLPSVRLSPPTARSYLSDPTFMPKVASLLNIDEPEELVVKCNIVSQIVCEAISNELSCGAYLTIGDVVFSGKPFFNVDEMYVRSLVAGGKRSLAAQGYRHHAWITLDSMEIIDFTMNTSMAMLSKDLSPVVRKQMLGGIVAGHADRLKGGVSYHPVLIGEAFYLEYDTAYPMLKAIYVAGLAAKP